jgi:trk system potassium uptake protein TrkA
MRRLTPTGSKSEWRDATGTVQLIEVHLHASWYGEAVTLIEKNTNARVAFITRLGEALIPDQHTVLQEGDLVHVIASDKEIVNIEKTLAKSPDGN